MFDRSDRYRYITLDSARANEQHRGKRLRLCFSFEVRPVGQENRRVVVAEGGIYSSTLGL